MRVTELGPSLAKPGRVHQDLLLELLELLPKKSDERPKEPPARDTARGVRALPIFEWRHPIPREQNAASKIAHTVIHEREPEIQWTQDKPLSEQATTYTAKPPQPSYIPMLIPTK